MTPKTERFTIALAGNPNSGKTTTFNNLTGTRQKVGNWPGVTVEKKLGHISHKGHDLTVVDLPGTYSLTAFSIEEIVARNFVLNEKPDLVVDVIDASNLERSLYLATQLRELDIPVLFVLNMMDVAAARGQTVDMKKLAELLDVPVVTTVGNKNQGTADLLDAIIDAAKNRKAAPVHRRVRYSRDIEDAVARVREKLNAAAPGDFPYNRRWTSIKLVEGDSEVAKTVKKLLGEKATPLFDEVQKERKHISGLFDDEPEILMTEQRYGFIAGIVREVLKSAPQARVDMSRSIDLVLTNRYLGFPL
ncbi:MAG: ferrous iron transporter B, partial [Desulfatibacillaceae bacterium]|nr:ferrous iron transporter B [Desulfatibacillaceae bacterium]